MSRFTTSNFLICSCGTLQYPNALRVLSVCVEIALRFPRCCSLWGSEGQLRPRAIRTGTVGVKQYEISA